MSERFCKICRNWHSLDNPWPDECLPRKPRAASDLPAPMLIVDTMAPVQSMLDGQMYDSKSALRATYKQAGVVEVGNDPQRFKPRQKPKPDRQAIHAAVKRARSRLGYGAP